MIIPRKIDSEYFLKHINKPTLNIQQFVHLDNGKRKILPCTYKKFTNSFDIKKDVVLDKDHNDRFKVFNHENKNYFIIKT